MLLYEYFKIFYVFMHVCMCTCVFLYVQMYVCVQMEAVGHTWVYLGTNALIFLKKTCFYLYVCMHLSIYLFIYL